MDFSTSMELKEEDDALLVLAANARAKVERARCAFGTADWKERKEVQGVHVFERKPAPGCFEVAASSILPCSAKEFLEVLSSRNSDDFNATMVALAGDVFSYAVTLREVPTASLNKHLSTKRMQLSGSIPLLSSSKTVEFLDYVEYDHKTRTAVRTFQTLSRDRAGRLVLGGDMMAGYVLGEQVASHQTSVFFFGTHNTSADSTSKGLGRLKAAAVREVSAQGLLKLAKLIPKIGDIALRRRFGAEDTIDLAADCNYGEHTVGRCSGCGKTLKDSLLRKKHVCYICSEQTCSSCSKAQDVEGLIGVVERLRICTCCMLSTRRRAFECHEILDYCEPVETGPVLLLRPSTLSVLSTASTARTTASSTRA
ncbi:hypothetical protein PHYBOEH_011793 [Phytophthora boehmeriae]|uniref:FYVE-type domain-containing protein n=1 Tax=Phytophthora boehmeriae TaxID=109152 RepID=A0A8T1WVB4_9STRA|nr:hypothetical protein PHYBOEH_011793 [Phytophthora boehmeriae]